MVRESREEQRWKTTNWATLFYCHSFQPPFIGAVTKVQKKMDFLLPSKRIKQQQSSQEVSRNFWRSKERIKTMQMSKVRGHKSVALGAKWHHFVRPVGLGFCFVLFSFLSWMNCPMRLCISKFLENEVPGPHPQLATISWSCPVPAQAASLVFVTCPMITQDYSPSAPEDNQEHSHPCPSQWPKWQDYLSGVMSYMPEHSHPLPYYSWKGTERRVKRAQLPASTDPQVA